jgi:hypothetical protein
MAVDIGFGIDTSVLHGPAQELDDTFTEINTVQILGEDVYKAVSCPSTPVLLVDDEGPFPLIFWEDPPVSFDLRDRLNDSIDPAETASIAGLIEAAFEQDERWDRGVQADVTYTPGTGELRAAVRGTASGIPLQLVLIAESNHVRVEAA